MASRKEQKEQARAARLAQEQEAASKAQRNRRFQMFGGVIAIAVIVIVVAIVVSSGGGGGPKGAHTGLVKTGTAAEHQLVSQVDTLLNKIPQNGTTLGDPSAPVTMQYFGDLECPVCQAFTLLVLPTFIEQEVRTDQVKVVYRSMCTATCDGRRAAHLQLEQFNSQQVAAYAAGKQDKFWQYIDPFYHQQETEGTGYADDAFLTGLAKQVPVLNVQAWQAARSDSALKAQLTADGNYANKAALSGTPTLIVAGKKGIEEVAGTYGSYAFPGPSQLAAAVKAVS
jgi:protein-disulfide isomerase